MNYRVVLQPRAFSDLEEQARYIAEQNPDAAAEWLRGFIDRISSLARFPERCPIAKESEHVRSDVRVLLVGKRSNVRRVYFAIRDDAVRVVCIRHSAQSGPSAEDLAVD